MRSGGDLVTLLSLWVTILLEVVRFAASQCVMRAFSNVHYPFCFSSFTHLACIRSVSDCSFVCDIG